MYTIYEFKMEESENFATEEQAREVFEKLREDNVPGIWQLYDNNKKLIDEFIGG